MGGVLSQIQEGSEKFIGCFSKSCDTAQKNYSSFKGVYLSSFDFDIEHRPGKQNLAADALSRTVLPNRPGDPEDPDSFLVYPDVEYVYNIGPQLVTVEGEQGAGVDVNRIFSHLEADILLLSDNGEPTDDQEQVVASAHEKLAKTAGVLMNKADQLLFMDIPLYLLLPFPGTLSLAAGSQITFLTTSATTYSLGRSSS